MTPLPDAWIDIVVRLSLSIVAGAVIGLNRDQHRKQAGVRTNALVALGAALAVVTVAHPETGDGAHVDAVSRVIQGVLTGVGFLGAGVILRDPESRKVSGLTTAAAIWLSALLGVACGAGAFFVVGVATVLAIVVVILGGPFEKRFRPPRDPPAGSPPAAPPA